MMLTMARDYGRKQGFKGVYLIEPKPKEPTKHHMTSTPRLSSVSSAITDSIKTSSSTSRSIMRCSAGHTFQHELPVRRGRRPVRSIDAKQGRLPVRLGHRRVPDQRHETTEAMLVIMQASGFARAASTSMPRRGAAAPTWRTSSSPTSAAWTRSRARCSWPTVS